jgi:hypothetical protein
MQCLISVSRMCTWFQKHTSYIALARIANILLGALLRLHQADTRGLTYNANVCGTVGRVHQLLGRLLLDLQVPCAQ